MSKIGWINVEDSLPEDGDEVLVFDGDFVVATYTPEHGWLDDACDICGPSKMLGITHWRRLPKPPPGMETWG